MPLRLLIVEDDDLVRELLVRYFSGVGCVVCAVATVEDARAQIAASAFAVILSDVLLVESTGLDLYEPLDSAVQARFVFMTGYAGLARERLEATGRPVVRKPFRLDQLWELIQMVALQ